MFPVGRENTQVMKQAQKVKERKMKNEEEEMRSPSGLQCDVFLYPLTICGNGVLPQCQKSCALCLNCCCQSLENN